MDEKGEQHETESAAYQAHLIARSMAARKEGRRDHEADAELVRRAREHNDDALRRLGD
jgi:hypothetical protein